MPNPFAAVAARFQPSARTVRIAALSSVVMTVIIVVSGGVVRLTGSGLGCPTWPQCTAGDLAPTGAMGVHGIIEFTNRLLTYPLCAAVGWTILAARARSPWRHELTRLGWLQFWVVVLNAVVGGLSVLSRLNPFMVAAHFVAAMLLLVAAVITWERTREGDAPARPLVPPPVRTLTWILIGTVTALTLVGTAVTGTGPHAGDSSAVQRMPFDWDEVTQLHADLVWLTCGLAVALVLVLRAVKAPAAARARVRDVLIMIGLQGVIGYVQYFLHLPEGVVMMHLAGASLLWIAVLRVPFALRDRGTVPEAVDVSVADEAETVAATGR
ncbi:cytochrome B [Mangrovactinospora gilvigrisea]|uniref:Cytochrome B n=1 Tax=Mangrovactinospora gilvigrisea TaxID=1428644 RepID=A0A1J7BJY2_9ACTN|nr:COX15/CtaA family protein [Mangrovactinospora gilvigrisea]OIV38995.1 cytochrome B [Mangrovactinospora gilvigrisea]